jgi:hypothetical protein
MNAQPGKGKKLKIKLLVIEMIGVKYEATDGILKYKESELITLTKTNEDRDDACEPYNLFSLSKGQRLKV